jgi:hypothetical protein
MAKQDFSVGSAQSSFTPKPITRPRYIATFNTRAAGIPCQVGVTSWDKFVPARVCGPVELCYPAEGGDGTWELLDLRGRPAPWLEAKLTQDDLVRLEREVFDHMERGIGEGDWK